jgi:hypothetical protein
MFVPPPTGLGILVVAYPDLTVGARAVSRLRRFESDPGCGVPIRRKNEKR